MKLKELNVLGLLRHVVNNVAMTEEYKRWSDEFSRKETIKSLKRVQEEFKKVDFTELSEDELRDLGFSKWSEEELPGVWLVPLYLYPCIPDGTELTSIFGEKAVKGTDEIDNDVRFGCLAYGITVKEPEILSVTQLGAVGQIGELLHPEEE
jgi:hypothetical protein